MISPQDFGLPTHKVELVQGCSAAERATTFREILSGSKKRKGTEATHDAVKDYIIANAAAGATHTLARSSGALFLMLLQSVRL